MTNGKWQMAHGECQMANAKGKCQMTDAKWPNGQRQMPHAEWQMPNWPLPFLALAMCHCLFGIGLLAICH